MKSKKPDSVAWDEESQRYTSSLLPYSTNVSGPIIKIEDVSSFKKKGVDKVQKIFGAKHEELVASYFEMMKEIEVNEMVYNSKYSFEPIIGETYHLYEDSSGKRFLSLINPTEWNKKHLMSVYLSSDMIWKKI